MLVVHSRKDSSEAMKLALHDLFINAQSVATCGEAAAHLRAKQPPHLVLTGAELADGTWSEILDLARNAPLPVNVIVLMRVVDIELYKRAVERGAFDCILQPPLLDLHYASVVIHAAKDALERRRAKAYAERQPARTVA